MIAPLAPSRRAFTLIELLVVISIIAILLTLLFPAADAAFEAAKKAKAKNDASQIAIAINAYMSEYGKLPPPADTGADDADANKPALWDALLPATGGTPPANDPNPRGIVFLEIPKAKNRNNGRVENAGQYLDSWGQPYGIALDGNYDNSVDFQGDPIRKTVIVWSSGKPKNGAANTDPKKFVKSWE